MDRPKSVVRVIKGVALLPTLKSLPSKVRSVSWTVHVSSLWVSKFCQNTKHATREIQTERQVEKKAYTRHRLRNRQTDKECAWGGPRLFKLMVKH